MGAATAFDLVEDRVISGYPVAVKPAHGVSASGVRRVDSVDQLGEAVSDALSFDSAVIIEQWIDGVGNRAGAGLPAGNAYALPPRVEIVAKKKKLLRYGRPVTHAGHQSSCSHHNAPASLSNDEGRYPNHRHRNPSAPP